MPDTNEQRDPVKEARELLNAPNAYTLRAQVRELIKTLCDELEERRGQVKTLELTVEGLLDQIGIRNED